MQRWLVTPLFTVVALALAPGGSRAEDACASFKWPLVRERSWLVAAHPTLASGQTLPTAEGAVTLALDPVELLAFPVPPERAPAAESHGAILRLPPLAKGGLYQITLSDEAWIDVVQDGKSIKSK